MRKVMIAAAMLLFGTAMFLFNTSPVTAADGDTNFTNVVTDGYVTAGTAITAGTTMTVGTTLTVNGTTLSGTEMGYVDGVTAGTMTASKAIVVDSNGRFTNIADNGAKNGATVTVVERGGEVMHKTILTCTATPVTITDDAGVAQYGGVAKLYDFPEGAIITHGAVIDGSVTLGTTGTIIATWAGGISLGTAAATTGATLTGTEADIMPEVDVAAATASVAVVDAVSVATALTESGARWFDGTATATDLYMNLVVDDDATHTSGTGTFTGTVTIIWSFVGDK